MRRDREQRACAREEDRLTPSSPRVERVRAAGRFGGRIATGVITAAATAAVVALMFVVRIEHERRPVQRQPASPVLGAYVGVGAKGVAALTSWERWTGVEAPYALDFASADAWAGITGPDWLLAPWRDSGRRLVYSTPLFPGPVGRPGPAASLAECAAGRYNEHWETLARNLVGYGLADAILRPGWEFNGDWYDWAAKGHEVAFIGCFRHLVTTMRSAAGQAFEFLWNPSLGPVAFPAERAYPGDAYVDYVGIDVYDTSWDTDIYQVLGSVDDTRGRAAAEAAWEVILNGDHGLRFWEGFSATHGKRLAVPEWGLSARTDGRGGGDNPYFIEQMFTFLRAPEHGVAFALYFDVDGSAENFHRISAANSRFPVSRARFQELVGP